jgi:formate C-acetyltransferase
MQTLQELRNFIKSKKHHVYRKHVPETLAEEYSRLGLDPKERMTRRFEYLSSIETPVILDGEQIVFLRTVENIPDCFTEAEWKEIRAHHFIHELGYISNVLPDYETVIREGLLKHRERVDDYTRRTIDAIFRLSDRYREEAIRIGRTDVAEILSRVPRYGARTFREALQMFRIIHFSLWLEGNYHVTCGRFDKYMYPYFKKDMEEGILNEDSALELIEDFFLSFNKDSDRYVGVQQGDNGQSMVLGGMDADGNEVFSTLSRLCLVASKNNHMIDPKINLRVSSKTPLDIFELGSELTKEGLGFPQYSNDDVVIDGLVKKGYALEDARDYAMAACWEFIIPKYGFDIANVGALSFPKVLDRVLHSGKSFDSFESLVDETKAEIGRECDAITAAIQNVWFVPSPLMETLLTVKYRNLGIHGTGLATAADSLSAIETYVYREKTVTMEALMEAVDSNFEDAPELLHSLRFDAPKMGQNDECADANASMLLKAFSDALDGRVNCFGGVYRAGTGSAMFYLRHAAEIGASPDGRRKGEPFGANYSPSLFAKVSGPFSVIESFTKPCLSDAINGGPLTVEFSSSLFRGTDGVHKTALFVRAFILKGGHQLQLNAVDAEKMKDAQEHPEAHQSLIVRIWGWSAYFIELDREYQDHVIARQAYQI